MHEVMRAHGWAQPSLLREFTTTRGHVTEPEPNPRIAADIATEQTREDAIEVVVLTVDCGCRSVLDVTMTTLQGPPAVLWPVEHGLLEPFGVSSEVGDSVEQRSGHGPPFTGADAAALATLRRPVPTFAPLGRPTGNGVAELTIHTTKVERLWLEEFDPAENFLRALDRWRATCNLDRPHLVLRGKTPAEVRTGKRDPKRAAPDHTSTLLGARGRALRAPAGLEARCRPERVLAVPRHQPIRRLPARARSLRWRMPCAKGDCAEACTRGTARVCWSHGG